MEAALADRLKKVARNPTLRLTHYGRKSGKPYQVTIWFVADDETIYLVTADLRRQWPRNVKARAKVTMQTGGETFSGEVAPIPDGAERERVRALLLRKYWYAGPYIVIGGWLATSGFITDHTGAFRVRLDGNSSAPTST